MRFSLSAIMFAAMASASSAPKYRSVGGIDGRVGATAELRDLRDVGSSSPQVAWGNMTTVS